MQFLQSLLNNSELNLMAQITIIICLILLLSIITFKLLLPLLYKAIERTKHDWDDLLMDNHFISRILMIVPIIFTDKLVKLQFNMPEEVESIFSRAISILITLVAASVILSVINTIRDAFSKISSLKTLPIDNIRQLAVLSVYLVSIIFIVSIIFNKSPLALLTGISAAMALVMLIFKDVILGFVAGVQLSLNRLVRVGDWIEFKKGSADGDVISVGLTVVKVRNFDKTITSIPVYDLVSNSFTNWRGMEETGARRIKRAIYLDQASIGHLSQENYDKIKDHPLLADYLKNKLDSGVSIAKPNELPATRVFSNLGTFRAYIEAYLNSKAEIRSDMLIMCRQLAPSSAGLPLEIYCFSDTNWKKYEAIQADVFDHILCAANYFDLKIYQFNLAEQNK